ncbi:MAG: hypothetical protein SGARI_003176, partial [Bacillariaceae sp.]
MFYFKTFDADDLSAQTVGTVNVIYALGKIDLTKFAKKNAIRVLQRMDDSLPHKAASFHFCFNDPLFHVAWKYVFDFTAEPEKRARCRCHFGTPQEVAYELMTFGIPKDALPITDDGKIKTKLHLELLEMKLALEELQAASSMRIEYQTFVLNPSRKDVLFGKGKRFQNHPGNMNLKHRVDDMLSRYDTLDKTSKTNFADFIVATLKSEGVHFLGQESGVWMEATDDIARSKVAQMFRNRRKIL